MIDLHTHTTCSDGTLTPEELIRKAKAMGLKAVAITDHDTVTGLDRGNKAAEEEGILFVPGVELEIEFPSGEFHLLGLGLKEWQGELSQELQKLKEFRDARNMKILKKINDTGVSVTKEELYSLAGGQIIARPHFARLLVDKGIAKNINEAFNKYLGVDKCFYEKKETLKLERATELIKRSGGIPVIAHPLSLFISWGRMPSVMAELKEKGVEGLEAWHSGNSRGDCTKLEKIASDLKMIVTGGSDYHGENRKERRLGMGAGQREVPDILLKPFNRSLWAG